MICHAMNLGMGTARWRAFTEVARQTAGLPVSGRTMADSASDLQLEFLAAKGWDPHVLAHEHAGSGPRSARRTLSAPRKRFSRTRSGFCSHDPAALQAIGRPDRLKIVELWNNLRVGCQRYPRLL